MYSRPQQSLSLHTNVVQEIRDRLLAEGIDDQWEEGVEGPSQAKEKKRRSDPHGLPTAKQQKRLSLPSKLQVYS